MSLDNALGVLQRLKDEAMSLHSSIEYVLEEIDNQPPDLLKDCYQLISRIAAPGSHGSIENDAWELMHRLKGVAQ